MNLSEYQAAAATTAQPKAYDHDYLIPMIVGEVGELLGQRAKSVWHGWTPERLQTELVSEYGDVCWGTAILLALEDVHDTKGFALRELPPVTVWGHKPDVWHQLIRHAESLYLFYTQKETHCYIVGEAKLLWLALERHCQAITGLPFEEVQQANLRKLAGRVERGTLVGSGDHR